MHPFAQATLGGIIIGLASWLLLASLGRIAGISGILGGALLPSKLMKVETGWRVAFVVVLVLVGAITSYLLKTPGAPVRPAWLLMTAGLLVGVGTTVGSGCTSGHGVCGLGRRSGRSLVATLVFMASGIATVFAVHLLNAEGPLQ